MGTTVCRYTNSDKKNLKKERKPEHQLKVYLTYILFLDNDKRQILHYIKIIIRIKILKLFLFRILCFTHCHNSLKCDPIPCFFKLFIFTMNLNLRKTPQTIDL